MGKCKTGRKTLPEGACITLGEIARIRERLRINPQPRKFNAHTATSVDIELWIPRTYWLLVVVTERWGLVANHQCVPYWLLGTGEGNIIFRLLNSLPLWHEFLHDTNSNSQEISCLGAE